MRLVGVQRHREDRRNRGQGAVDQASECWLDTLEEKLHNPKAEVTYDILAQRGGAKLYSQFAFLFETVKDGDGLPTQGIREVYAEQTRALQQLGSALNGLVSGELAKLNETAKHLDIPNIIISAVGEKVSK